MVRWEDSLLRMFDDLEQRAEGLHLEERDAEVRDRSRAAYRAVTLGSRLQGSVGAEVSLLVEGVGPVRGRMDGAGVDWCLVEAAPSGGQWVVRSDAVSLARGLSSRSVPEQARPVATRLGFGAVLRRLAEDRAECSWHLRDGTAHHGVPVRVGADFVELAPDGGHAGEGDGGLLVVAFGALAAVRDPT